MDDDVLWMTATASRRKKHNHRAKDDHRRSDRPERSRHTRNTKERSHDRSRHTEAIEKPLNNAGKRHLLDDRADPSERVRAWVQRTQNRHPHRSLPTAPDSDERLRRTSSPRYRETDIIRSKKRGRSVSRSPSVSFEHGFESGQVEPRFEKRRRYKTHEDKYEYKGEINRRKQPNKERNQELEQEAGVRTNRVPLRLVNTGSRVRAPDHTFAPVSKHHPQPNYAQEPRQSSSSSKLFDDHHHSGHRSLVLPSRSSRKYDFAHRRDSPHDLGQDDSYFSSSSKTSTVAHEKEREHRRSANKRNHYGQPVYNNNWPGIEPKDQQEDQINHTRPSVERPPVIPPPVQLATPLAQVPKAREGSQHVPSVSRQIVTVVLPRYKDVETQTDLSLLAGLQKPSENIPKSSDDSADNGTHFYRGHEIQRRIQLLPDSPYLNTKPAPTDGIKHEPSYQHQELSNMQAYSFEHIGEQRHPGELVTSHIVPTQPRHYVQAPNSHHTNGRNQMQYLGQYHTSDYQPLHTNTSTEGWRNDRRLSDLVQRHEAGSPPRTMIASQQLGQRFGNRVRFQEPNLTFQRPEAPYTEDIDEFIRRIEEEDLGELSDALAVESNSVPVKTEEYLSLEELEDEGPKTTQDGERRRYEPLVGVDGFAENSDTEILMGPRTPEPISRLPVSRSTRCLGQDRAYSSLTGRVSRFGRGLVRPGQYRELYET
ncbi:hypothetical protein QBC41DRAFT_6976 [Cercophora samala]|uniref:Uncharacterized protein n=1 Tax=Cercophora samala TaxID=330535 RepID=A0AA39ZKQ0_9PEZI|nr:hypothetical protein QBC41DRAFT_6976 [Cercophora samala]